MKQTTFTQTFMVALATLLLLSVSPAKAISIIKSAGGLETAYVEWQKESNVARYNVYYQLAGGEKTQIDNQLIRVYPDCMRADVLGLKEGNYTLTVEAVNESGNTIETQDITSLEVKPNVREGFAFAAGNIPGAYKMEEHLKIMLALFMLPTMISTILHLILFQTKKEKPRRALVWEKF